MVCKKIKNSSASLAGIVTTLLIVIGMFFVSFLYLQSQTEAAGITIPTKYNDTFTRLNNASKEIDNNVYAIQDSLNNVSEADNTYQVALNGFKFLGYTLKLPITFISRAVDVTSAILIPIDVIPNNIKSLILIGIIGFVIFVILAIMKGDPKIVN